MRDIRAAGISKALGLGLHHCQGILRRMAQPENPACIGQNARPAITKVAYLARAQSVGRMQRNEKCRPF
jgi:hypothetical protein